MGQDVHDVYDIRKSLLGNWYIAHPRYDFYAWSGTKWVRHYKGVPISDTQVANFADPADLHKYAFENFDRISKATLVAEEESTQE